MGWTKPKCLLPCPGGALLDHMLRCLIEHEIRDVVMVVGYQRGLIEQCAGRHELRIQFVENPLFEASNTAFSLALVRNLLQGDWLYLNADVWFECDVLQNLLSLPTSALLVDPGRNDVEAVKVAVDHTGRITGIGKHLGGGECAGEFVGIGLFRSDLCAVMRSGLERIATTPNGRDLYFESVVDEVLDQVVVQWVPMSRGQALEIDTPEDFHEARRLWKIGE